MKFATIYVVPFFGAVVLAIFTLNTDAVHPYFFSEKITKKLSVPKNFSTYYSNYDSGIQTELDLAFALKNKNTVVVFGSSELGSDDPQGAIPFRFIPEKTGINVLAMGRAGNQLFSIYSQLLALHKNLNHAKIVVILSTGWFSNHYAEGTSLASFLEFNSNRFLSVIMNDSTIPDEFKNPVFDYVAKNFNNINAPTRILKKMNMASHQNKNIFSALAYYPLQKWNDKMISLIHPTENIELENVAPIQQEKKINANNIPWDSLCTVAIHRHELTATNNSWGINNEYFNTFIKGEKKEEDIVPLHKNQEYADFLMLLKLFKHYHVKATFVIQALNPYAYKNLNEVTPFVKSMEQELKKNNFPCLNLYVENEKDYQKGLLTDALHMGAYGWYKMDRFILTSYFTDETKSN